MLVMLVVSVVRWGRRFRGNAAFRRGCGADAGRRRSLFSAGGGIGGVAFGRRSHATRRHRYPSLDAAFTAITDTVAATSLARMMLVRARRSSTPTMVSAARVQRGSRSDTVVG